MIGYQNCTVLAVCGCERIKVFSVNFTVRQISQSIQFIKRIENVNGISVIEDSSVDKGGCIVETDFGAIDARISSQLAELESKIMEISPVKSVSKSDATLEK